MADKNAAPTEEYNEDGSPNPEYVDPKEAGEGAADTENKGTKDEPEEEGDPAFDDTIDPTKPPEIPTRKSNLQHIISRKNEKIKKLASKLDEKEEDPEDPEEEPEDSAVAKPDVAGEVQKQLAPVLNKLAIDADESEMKDLIANNPEAKKYENHIKAYMSHDAWKNVPVAAIYHHLAFSAAQAQGAKKKAAADLSAKQHKSAGRSAPADGNTSGLPSAADIENMSEADFAKLEEDVLQGKFSK